MIVVTGGAGFIGSALVHALNGRGMEDIVIVDVPDHPEKERNLASLRYATYLDRETFLEQVQQRTFGKPDALFHMGACSSTTETDAAFLNRNNLEYSKTLAEFAMETGARFIYASSAATYGNGDKGYSDNEAKLHTLRPLNLYGDSKHQFDLWVQERDWLEHIVGLKYFNVYGPNEYHKEDMRSLVLKGFFQIQETRRLRLFKSYRPEYADGGQERDFVYIKDAVSMTLFFMDHPEVNGIFNIGSGTARNWNDLAHSLFRAMNEKTLIEYIDMPDSIREQYQYHTCADMGKIREAGYHTTLASLEEGVENYVRNYLIPGKRLSSQD